MTYKLTAYAKTRRNLPGVPWRDLTDEEYEAAVAAHPGMEERGYFERVVEEATSPVASPRRSTRATSDDPADSQTDEGQG